MSFNPVADLLTRIRNGQLSKKKKIIAKKSKFAISLLDILVQEGYIASHQVLSETQLEINLKYYDNKPVIQIIKQRSKPSCRLYVKSSEISKFFGGLGISILSTSSGVMTDKRAREISVGGELICSVF